MLKFEAISTKKLEDYLELKRKCPSRNINDSFFFMWAWKDLFKYEWTFSRNMCWIRYYQDGKIYYKVPIGQWKKKNWVNLFTKQLPLGAELKNVSEEFALKLHNIENNNFSFREDPEDREYIYNQQDLAELSGKKLHVKRQHAHFFERVFEYEQKEIDEEDIKDIKLIFQFENRQAYQEHDLEFAEEEYTALCRLLKDWNIFKKYLRGKIIRVQDQPVSFIIGEKQNNDQLLILFEKSLSNVKGAGAMCWKLFIKEFPDVKYVNWGQDFGQADKKKQKERSNPCSFIKKYNTKLINKS